MNYIPRFLKVCMSICLLISFISIPTLPADKAPEQDSEKLSEEDRALFEYISKLDEKGLQKLIQTIKEGRMSREELVKLCAIIKLALEHKNNNSIYALYLNEIVTIYYFEIL